MFASKRQNTTVIAEGLKIVGSVTADGLVEVNGQVDGELHCETLVVTRKAYVAGRIAAQNIVVDGKVEGPILGGDVVLKSQAHVVGDIACESVMIEKGAFIEGRLIRSHGLKNGLAHDPAHGVEAPLENVTAIEPRHLPGKAELAH